MRRREPAPEVGYGEELLPGYRAVERLAHGRRLDTWDAFDVDRGTRCVVKVLRSDRVDEPEVVAAVLREGEILTSLAHPHLVRAFDVIGPPRPAVVLETLRGATLAALIEDGPLPLSDVAMLGLQLVSALRYLHRHDWLHLDVKPENVVAEHGKAVLIDLSLAGRPGDGRPGAGTDGYLSPEQASGRGLSPASDVFGLGATLHESLTGELPPGARDTRESGARRRWPRRPARANRRPGDWSPLPPELPREVADMLRAAVAPDPLARPGLDDVTAALAPHAAQ